jgi:peroxiredoxin Q/BCP
VVLGVSTDGVDSHKQFCDKEKLPYDLLADPDKKVHESFGFKGKVRALILVDKKGAIAFLNRKFDLKKESWDALYAAVDALPQ